MSLRVLSLIALVVACVAVARSQNQDLEPSDVAKLHQERAANDYLQTLGLKRDPKDQSFMIGYNTPAARFHNSVSAEKPGNWQNETVLVVTVGEVLQYGPQIFFIVVQDTMKTGMNANVTLLSGGPGHQTATLEFRNQLGGPVGYYMNVYVV